MQDSISSSVQNSKVSILIAARNEEKNISQLLQSVASLSFPKDRLEVIIGDDLSTDSTAAIIEPFICNNPYMRLVSIEESTTELKGKTNVLVQLIEQASGDFYLFTDADITLPINWVQQLLRAFEQPEVGVVIGSTTTKPISIFARCQGIEWLNVLNFMAFCGNFNIPTTGMGNNMAVSKQAYDAVGGYKGLPFSIVEDYALYDAIIKKGFGFKHLYNSEVLAYTAPPENYFMQRKRWVTGGVASRSPLLLAAFIQALTFPVIFAVFVTNVFFGLKLLFFVLVVNMLVGYISLKKVELKSWSIYLPIYSVYVVVFWFLQLINYLLPNKLFWKGRKY